jgi:hypothetical protein
MPTDLTGGLPIEREYVYTECPERDGTRDAVNVWIEEDGGAFGMRIGVEAAAPTWDRHELWLDIAFAGGRVISLRGDGESHSPIGPDGKASVLGTGPLAFRCVTPFQRWTASFDGTASETTAQDLIDRTVADDAPQVDISFEIEMTMAVPPWVPGSLLPEAGAILNGGDQGDFMSPRYEQLFNARGTLVIGGERIEFTGKGLRIRRSGYRKFEGFWGHCWQSALFPSGKAFGFNIYPPRPDGAPSYAEGYIFDGQGALQPAWIVSAPWLTTLVTGGEHVPLVLETATGQVSIDGTSFANTRSLGSAVLPPDFPIVQQAHCRYSWDGEESVGMMERSSTPDKFTDR